LNASTKDRIAGTLDEVEGRVKQTAGQLVGNERLELEGQAQYFAGKLQNEIGHVEELLESNTARATVGDLALHRADTGAGTIALPAAVGGLALLGGVVLLAEEKK